MPHESSEAHLLEALRQHKDRHIHRAIIKTLRRTAELSDHTIHSLFDHWLLSNAETLSLKRCVRTCVRKICNPYVHRHGCRKECHEACDAEAKTRDELLDVVKVHTRAESPGRGRKTHYDPSDYSHLHPVPEEGYQPRHGARDSHFHRLRRETVVGADAAVTPSLSRPRGRRLFDWNKIAEAEGGFDKFSLTFVDLRIKLPGSLDIRKKEGAAIGNIGYFGIAINVVVDNRGWLRLGMFGGGFGLHFVDYGEAIFYPGFNPGLELFYAGLRFKFDATYRVRIAETFAKLANKGASIIDKMLDARDSILGFFISKLQWMIKLLQRVDGNLEKFLARIPGGGEMTAGGVFDIVKNNSKFVMGIVSKIQNATNRIMQHPGVKVVLKLKNQTEALWTRMNAFLDDTVIQNVVYFYNMTESVLSCASYIAQMFVPVNMTELTIDGEDLNTDKIGIVPGEDTMANCLETVRLVQAGRPGAPALPPPTPPAPPNSICNQTAEALGEANYAGAVINDTWVVGACVNATKESSLIVMIRKFKEGTQNLIDQIDAVRNREPYRKVFQALGSPMDPINLPPALAYAVNYTSTGEGEYVDWEVKTMQLLIDGDFERAGNSGTRTSAWGRLSLTHARAWSTTPC